MVERGSRDHILPRLGLVGVLALVAGLAGPVAPAQASTILPTVFTDDLTNNGNCTLREAIVAANDDFQTDLCPAGSGADTIVLQAGTYSLTDEVDGDLSITADTTITGAGPALTIIDGAWPSTPNRIFRIIDKPDVVVSMSGVTIQDGSTSGDGGGILAQANTILNLTDVVVTSNEAAGQGGGIQLEGAGMFTNMTVSANTALSGGGIRAFGPTLALTNVTISGNSVTGSGGGIETFNEVTLNNVTIAGNTANADNAPGFDEGGGVVIQGGTFTARNTIIADNTVGTGGTNPDCSEDPGFTSQGHNLVEDPGTDCQVTGPGDIVGQDPLLGPLADNGGPTPTHALLLGSPAIDAGGTDCAPTDQRGLPRSTCEIGAYELVLCQKVPVNRIGTEAKDALKGTAGADGLLGLGKDDRLAGKAGKDGLCGGPGKDTLKGGGSKDRLDGGPGKDTCIGQAGRDKARGCEEKKSIP